MSIQFFDSFDYYATADIGKKWDVVNGSPVINAAGGRNSGGGIEFDTASEYVEKNITGTPATIVIAGAFKVSSLSVAQEIVKIMDTASIQVKIRINTDGKIEAFRDATSLGVSAAVVFTAGAFAHLDIKVTINDASGTVSVISGATTHLNLTSQDTKNTANAYCTSVRIGGDGTNTVSCDDFYIVDTAGAAPQNDRLGDCRVSVSRPNVEGTYSSFTPNVGTDNSANVDDTTPDADTTYNSSSSVGTRDSFGLAAMVDIGGATIFGVQANVIARKDAAGTRKVRVFSRPVGTNYFGVSQTLTTSYLNFRELWQTNPETTLEWAESEVNLTQIGYEVAS